MSPAQDFVLFTLDDLEREFKWIFKIRKKYSENSDIWNLCRNWDKTKHALLEQLNDGTYIFSPLERYEMDDGAIISLWSSQDMIALKLITQTLGDMMANYIPHSCYHIKDHGGLKKAVQQTSAVLPEYQFVFRSDIKGYYESINFDSLIEIIKSYVKHPILLQLVKKACLRTETRGGVFYDYHDSGVPKGSPLSPFTWGYRLNAVGPSHGSNERCFLCSLYG